MKVLLLALVLALVFANGSSLTCHRCIPDIPGGNCGFTEETCVNDQNACVAVAYKKFPYSYFRRCINMEDCSALESNRHLYARCCQTDLCN
ncbi:CD59 glycoprotein [Danio rerio]|uniref:CD59 glycoprotein n=1 Tax=Danio rerio TaxID=7955 RepID=A0A2R8QJM0_DANRE|nr:CD59A glycoprotein-like [Danio rerio]|eukprot:XP_009297184.1 CD59A glycoprotein-like [Danio rerio]